MSFGDPLYGELASRFQEVRARSRTSGKTGGGAFFAFLTRRPLIPWEDGSPRRPGRTLPDRTEGACHRVAGQGGGPRADSGSPARGDRAAQRAEGPTSSEAKWDGKGQ